MKKCIITLLLFPICVLGQWNPINDPLQAPAFKGTDSLVTEGIVITDTNGTSAQWWEAAQKVFTDSAKWSNGGGGTTQDLQSVLDQGSSASITNALTIGSSTAINFTNPPVNIGTNSNTTYAGLQLNSTTSGALFSRMFQAQRDLITPDTDGIIIYCTNCSLPGYYVYEDAAWRKLGDDLGNHYATEDLKLQEYDATMYDSNNGIGFYGDVTSGTKYFNAVDVDGPVIYGQSGGALGDKSGAVENISLTWNSTGDVAVTNGTLAVNQSTAQAVVDISSTTSGVLLPRMTNAQLDAMSPKIEGMVAYNLDNHTLTYFNGTIWVDL